MLRCEHCKVDLPGMQKCCPLCQHKPAGVPDDSGRCFPSLKKDIPTVERIILLWAAFGSVCAAAVCITLNLILPSGGIWSLFVIARIISLWADFALIIKKRKNLPKTILWQVAAVSLIAFVWDLSTGFHGWSLDYVLPILCSCAMIAMAIVSKVRRLVARDYILYLVIDCTLGIICFVLILAKAVRVVIPSAISFGASLIFLSFLIFFEGKALWTELQRRFHL